VHDGSRKSSTHPARYLNEAQASGLLEDVVSQYLNRAGVMPDRVVIHKTSGFAPDELDGFNKAAKNRVSKVDLYLASTDVVPDCQERPRRTLARHTLHIDGSIVSLFRSGYLPWWNEYPGMHIPAPLELGSAVATNIKDRAKEILTLTKMNWNSSDGIARLPITLLFARRVGELMCELSDNATPKPSYRFYI
jgi:argonaute-like protein implicated in RNA metabolism and viral defense